MTLQLGIDTGGTFTDAVIVDGNNEVLAKCKSLTTASDLVVGIGNAVASLPEQMLRQVCMTALSTTLTTNSVVEGRGAPVCVLLPGYSELQVERSGLYDILDKDRIHILAGGHSATGVEQQSLNMALAREIILSQQDKVSAFAVSAMFGIRNAAHETALRDLIAELTDKPVACGHELASSLGAPKRALTVVLNARMILYIKALIDSVEQIMDKHAIRAPLMIVNGDGSLVSAATARLRPVSTVLSGPAASVIGACALSGRNDALVVDIGGTTTDIAIVTDGRPELCDDGARIGDWQPMVEAIRVFSAGLGGDSEVRFNGRLCISERRVVPVSLLAHQYPDVIPALELQLKDFTNARHNRFALRLQNNRELLQQLNASEQYAWELLSNGPVDMNWLAMDDRSTARAMARLERLGLVIFSGFTPSDASHVLGLSQHWDSRAADLGARLWARQMRHLYGCGKWDLDDPVEPCQQVFDLVVHQICEKLIEAGLHQYGELSDRRASQFTRMLADLILMSNDKIGGPTDSGETSKVPPAVFELKFAQRYPLVAVGGPAGDYFPEVARLLGMELCLPEHADVANAVGAVMGSVTQQFSVTVTQPENGRFHVFYKDRPRLHSSLEPALQEARLLASDAAREMAEAAGAGTVEVRITEKSNHVSHDIDGELFVEAVITAIASGRPMFSIH